MSKTDPRVFKLRCAALLAWARCNWGRPATAPEIVAEIEAASGVIFREGNFGAAAGKLERSGLVKLRKHSLGNKDRSQPRIRYTFNNPAACDDWTRCDCPDCGADGCECVGGQPWLRCTCPDGFANFETTKPPAVIDENKGGYLPQWEGPFLELRLKPPAVPCTHKPMRLEISSEPTARTLPKIGATKLG